MRISVIRECPICTTFSGLKYYVEKALGIANC